MVPLEAALARVLAEPAAQLGRFHVLLHLVEPVFIAHGFAMDRILEAFDHGLEMRDARLE
jgi:hypothetical protein